MIIFNAIPTVSLSRDWENDQKVFTLRVAGIEVIVSDYTAEKLAARFCDRHVYSVNEPGIFHDPAYQDWAIMPHAACMVAGNIYCSTREQAENRRTFLLREKIRREQERANKEITALQKLLEAT